jgi:hypothetical protein
MLPTQTLFNRALKLWYRRPGGLVWDAAEGATRIRSIDEIWAERLPGLPASDYPGLVARIKQIERRAYELSLRTFQGHIADEPDVEVLMREFPELAWERASDALARGYRTAAY